MTWLTPVIIIALLGLLGYVGDQYHARHRAPASPVAIIDQLNAPAPEWDWRDGP